MDQFSPFELAALITFILSYGFIAVCAYFSPAKYQEEEVRFYKERTFRFDEIWVFGFGILSVIAVLLHIIFEGPKLSQGFLYLQIAMFLLVLPFHFIDFYQMRMASTLQKKDPKDYKNSGLRKFIVIFALILLPFVVPS